RPIADVGAGRDADAAYLRSERIRYVVAVEIESRNDVVLLGAQQHLLQKVVGDHVLHHDFMTTLGVSEGQPRSRADGTRAELLARHLVAPVAERTFGELHDVALVHQCHRYAILVDGVLQRLAHQALTSLLRDGLDADAGAVWEAHGGDLQLTLQE